MLIVITLISMISILTMLKYKRQDFIKQETSPESFFAIYINDEKVTHLPSNDEKLVFDEEKSYCNNGVSIQWSYLLWTANIGFTDYELQNKERTYCNLYFKKEEYTFDYTGSEQEFVVPKEGYYQIELWGASAENAFGRTGAGAYTKGDIYLLKDENLFLYIGGMQAYNGGGGVQTIENDKIVRYGGGATDIRINNGAWDNIESLSSRLMVAAGGGGYSHGGNGALVES